MSPTGPAPWTLPRQRTPQAERTNHRQAELNTARSTARQEAQERRRRVLAHPDLAAALRELSYGGYPEPEMWNGYVPPKVDGYGRVNNSPRRDDLVAICAEAMRREKVAA